MPLLPVPEIVPELVTLALTALMPLVPPVMVPVLVLVSVRVAVSFMPFPTLEIVVELVQVWFVPLVAQAARASPGNHNSASAEANAAPDNNEEKGKARPALRLLKAAA